MHARSTSLMAEPAALDSGIAYVRDDVWPVISGMRGCMGLSMLVDRKSGRSIVTTSWEDQDSLHESAAAVLAMRDRGVQVTRSSQPRVEEWEIASMHRAHPTEMGTCVRAAWSRVAPANVEGALMFYRSTLLPEIESLAGFVSVSLLLDRAAGRAVTSVAFEDRAAMVATRDQADYLRAMSSQEASVEFLDVAEFELALAHLRVPELV